MSLKRKYFKMMIIGLISIPIVFIIVNYMMLIAVIISEKILNKEIKDPFNGTILTFITYSVFFLILFSLIIIGSRYISKIIKRINQLEDTIKQIAYNEALPEKLKIKNKSRDEIDELGLSINLLIDRLRYKEIELLERTKAEQNHIDQISHDINTPLTALRLELFHLSQQYGIEDENIEVSYERIDYISKLIKNISIDQKENIQYFYTFNHEVDVVRICKKIIDKWQYLIQKQNMNIKLEGVQNQLIWLGEELWFERLFENIISNIYEHSNAKNIKVTIKQNQVSFVDDGIGFKVDNYQDSNGLNIIKNIADRFSLELRINSSNNGTEITVRNNQKTDVTY
ncbi:ATP-binding protein [Mammaliicoccus sciuri]|uniref:ATP-binding protein n=1 Tax=Mammaliicoccus sciuri TaxID=1296 RepID=UPI003BA3DFE5